MYFLDFEPNGQQYDEVQLKYNPVFYNYINYTSNEQSEIVYTIWNVYILTYQLAITQITVKI